MVALQKIYCWMILFCLTGWQVVAQTEQKEAQTKETMAEFLLRRHVLLVDYQANIVALSPYLASYNTTVSIFKELWEHIESCGALTSPLEMKVFYTDTNMNRIHTVTCGKSIWSASLYRDLTDYLQASRAYLERNLGFMASNVKTVGFQEAQQSDFLGRQTVMGEYVRVYGLTPALETMIVGQIKQFAQQHHFYIQKLFYYGSRVMPRSEVVKRDPALNGCLPIVEHGNSKSVIRVGGYVNVSDLEIALVVNENKNVKQHAKEWRQELKQEIQERFAQFPVSIHFFSVPTTCANQCLVQWVKSATLIGKTVKKMSPFQWALS